jgi:hypothetical protein
MTSHEHADAAAMLLHLSSASLDFHESPPVAPKNVDVSSTGLASLEESVGKMFAEQVFGPTVGSLTDHNLRLPVSPSDSLRTRHSSARVLAR